MLHSSVTIQIAPEAAPGSGSQGNDLVNREGIIIWPEPLPYFCATTIMRWLCREKGCPSQS
jgi:hypothetical protein